MQDHLLRLNKLLKCIKFWSTICEIPVKQTRDCLLKYKSINFAIGISALLIYKLIMKSNLSNIFYNNKINDIHIADISGNTFGTLPTIFFLISILSIDMTNANYVIKLGTLCVVVFELASLCLASQ